MASRASNFCIDAADPLQTIWWAKVLEDFTVEDDWEMEPDDEECGLAGPDDRYLLFLKVPEPKSVKNRMHICLRLPTAPATRRSTGSSASVPRWSTTCARDRTRSGRCWPIPRAMNSAC